MRIVSWNCNGALRKKFRSLRTLEADVYIVQECEDPKQIRDLDQDFRLWSDGGLWVGDNKNKGLGIFTSSQTTLRKLDWPDSYDTHTVKLFSPCVVNEKFNLLGVWTKYNDSPNFGYIGQFWKYLQTNKHLFNNILIAGDFNSNKIWDEWDRWWNHSDVIKELEEVGIRSIYHSYFHEEQGKETSPTFFLHRSITRPYHIDYFFGSEEFTGSLKSMEIAQRDTWLSMSDHLPIICEFSIP